MALPLQMPLPPMEALSVDDVPVGAEWQYEPKWDGFRALAFRDPELLVSQVGAFSLCRQLRLKSHYAKSTISVT
jgi:ATP-dependent DNA ligase